MVLYNFLIVFLVVFIDVIDVVAMVVEAAIGGDALAKCAPIISASTTAHAPVTTGGNAGAAPDVEDGAPKVPLVDNRTPEFDLGEMPALGGSKPSKQTSTHVKEDAGKKAPMAFSYAAAMSASAAPASAPSNAGGVNTAAVFVK